MDILWAIALIAFILWFLGFSLHVGGGIVHVLLVIALVIAIIRLLQGRKVI